MANMYIPLLPEQPDIQLICENIQTQAKTHLDNLRITQSTPRIPNKKRPNPPSLEPTKRIHLTPREPDKENKTPDDHEHPDHAKQTRNTHTHTHTKTHIRTRHGTPCNNKQKTQNNGKNTNTPNQPATQKATGRHQTRRKKWKRPTNPRHSTPGTNQNTWTTDQTNKHAKQ